MTLHTSDTKQNKRGFSDSHLQCDTGQFVCWSCHRDNFRLTPNVWKAKNIWWQRMLQADGPDKISSAADSVTAAAADKDRGTEQCLHHCALSCKPERVLLLWTMPPPSLHVQFNIFVILVLRTRTVRNRRFETIRRFVWNISNLHFLSSVFSPSRGIICDLRKWPTLWARPPRVRHVVSDHSTASHELSYPSQQPACWTVMSPQSRTLSVFSSMKWMETGSR